MSPMSTTYEERPPSRMKVAAVVGFYMVSALVMVFVNKAVLTSSPDLPFTFLFIQLIIALGLLHLLAAIVPQASGLKPKVALPEITAEMAYRMLPVVGVGIVALVFNTLCLRTVDASFFQIARGLLLPCTILVTSMHTRLAPRSPVIRAAALVTAGFFIGISPSSFFKSGQGAAITRPDMGSSGAGGEVVAGDVIGGEIGFLGLSGMDDEKVLALVYGTLSALMTAVHAVMVKGAIRALEGSVLRLTYWSNFLSAAFLLPCIIFSGELPIFYSRILFPTPSASLTLYAISLERTTFILGSLLTGLFGFLLGLAGVLSIKVTSPVTHMVSSALRSVLQTILGVVVFGEIVSGRRGASIGVITLGAGYYTWVMSDRPSGVTPVTSPSTEEEEKGVHTRRSRSHKRSRSYPTMKLSSSTDGPSEHVLPLHSPISPTATPDGKKSLVSYFFTPIPPSPTSPSAHRNPRRSSSGSSSGSGSRLGSISEEEEEEHEHDVSLQDPSHARPHGHDSYFAHAQETASPLSSAHPSDDEKIPEMQEHDREEDDRERVVRSSSAGMLAGMVRPHRAHMRMDSEAHFGR